MANSLSHTDGPSVVLSHAGIQYSYQIALAIQEAGFLREFWTSWYSLSDGQKFPPLFKGYVGRRHYPGLNPRFVRCHPWPEIFQRILTLAMGRNYFTTSHLVHWRNRRFDRCVSRRLGKARSQVFIGLSGSCLLSLQKAKELGMKAVVDQHDIHYSRAAQLLEQERRLSPDFAHSIPYWPPFRDYLEIVKKELEVADCILVPSTFSLNTHLQAGIPKNKLVLMLHGLDRPPAGLTAPRPDSGPFRILFTGTLTQRKGIRYLLEAVKQLGLTNSELWLIGDTMLSPAALKPYAGLYHYHAHLPHADFMDRLRTADVVVLPSIYDAFGLSALDAMSAEVPVIVSENTAAGSDIVRDGVDGFVVPIRDIEALKDRLLRLYQNPSLRRQMGVSAGERAKEFSWGRYSERMKDFLQQVHRSGCAGRT